MHEDFAALYRSYEKIADSLQQWYLNEDGYRQLEKLDWVVTEKIHGANFCFITDGQSIICANRKHFLKPDEPFFSYQKVKDRLSQTIVQVYGLIRLKYPQIKHVLIYGELFGGCYPHPDVSPDLLVQPIQTGVCYCPGIEFCAFDIAIEQKDTTCSYIDYDQTVAICQQAGLFYAQPLLIGSYQQAFSYPASFTSTIPARLNLPPLTKPNLAEGIVIKPLQAVMLATTRGFLRPILKQKIAAFAEDKRYNEAQRWPLLANETTLQGLELLKWEVFNLVTENRLQSAISKVGIVRSRRKETVKQARYPFRLLVEDVLDQVIINQEELYFQLDNDKKKQLLCYIEEEVRKIIKTYFSHWKAGLK